MQNSLSGAGDVLTKIKQTKPVVLMVFGSHLYGTNTPDSDMDYKVVFLPTWEELALGKMNKGRTENTNDHKSRNSSDDIDCEYISLHQFIKLALEGQTLAMDMLHAPPNNILSSNAVWTSIIANREKFYTKNVETFIGYALGQASKYGIKGSRLNDAKAVLDWLIEQMQEKDPNVKIKDCDLFTFPKGEHITWMVDHQGIDMVEVCNRKFNVSTKLHYARDIVNHFYEAYGLRAKQAANDEGVDWKAISHAFRAAYQIKSLFKNGTIIFPLPEREFVKAVKLGKYKYIDCAVLLEDLIDEVKHLKEISTLPEKPDYEFWDKWLITTVKHFVVPSSIYGSGRYL